MFKENPTELLQKEFNTNIVNETIGIIEVQKVETQEIKINEELAKRSKENMSFDSYKEGSATESYNRVIEGVAKEIEEAKTNISDEGKIKLDNLLTWYKRTYANWINKHNANGSRHVSQMISGAGNYNMRKHEKFISREGKLWEEYHELKDISDKISKIVNSDKIIKSNDKDALEKLREKLQLAEEEHKNYKDYNTKARKENKEVYPTYVLQNSNQRIKNIKDRISYLEKLEELKQTKGNIEIEINGIKIIDNVEANRLQIVFNYKPDADIRAELKRHGFRWSGSNGAWQRFRSQEAERIAKQIVSELEQIAV